MLLPHSFNWNGSPSWRCKILHSMWNIHKMNETTRGKDHVIGYIAEKQIKITIKICRASDSHLCFANWLVSCGFLSLLCVFGNCTDWSNIEIIKAQIATKSCYSLNQYISIKKHRKKKKTVWPSADHWGYQAQGKKCFILIYFLSIFCCFFVFITEIIFIKQYVFLMLTLMHLVWRFSSPWFQFSDIHSL